MRYCFFVRIVDALIRKTRIIWFISFVRKKSSEVQAGLIGNVCGGNWTFLSLITVRKLHYYYVQLQKFNKINFPEKVQTGQQPKCR